MVIRELIKPIYLYVYYFIPEGSMRFRLRTVLLYFMGYIAKELLVNRGDTVLQLGCWRTETMEIWSRLAGPRGKVIIIEADDVNFNILKIEAQRRELNNVTLVKKGVWSKKGSATLQVSSITKRNKIKEAQTYSPRNPSENYDEEKKIEVDTVDNILAETGVKKVDHIHLTISGAEIEALEGMYNVLKHRGTRILIRAIVLHEKTQKPSNIIVEEILRKKGFCVYRAPDEKKRNGSNVYGVLM